MILLLLNEPKKLSSCNFLHDFCVYTLGNIKQWHNTYCITYENIWKLHFNNNTAKFFRNLLIIATNSLKLRIIK